MTKILTFLNAVGAVFTLLTKYLGQIGPILAEATAWLTEGKQKALDAIDKAKAVLTQFDALVAALPGASAIEIAARKDIAEAQKLLDEAKNLLSE